MKYTTFFLSVCCSDSNSQTQTTTPCDRGGGGGQLPDYSGVHVRVEVINHGWVIESDGLDAHILREVCLAFSPPVIR
jgi:hypothetical protein